MSINPLSFTFTVDLIKLEIVLYTLFVLSCLTVYTALFRPLCRVSLNLPGLYEPKLRAFVYITVPI